MKFSFKAFMLGFLFPLTAFAQTLIPIPDTLSGAVIDLNIQNGTKQFYANVNTNTIGYNGNYLGPTIILQKGQSVTMNVHNQLSDTTTTHWHGLHVAPMNDGGPHMPILPGTTWSPNFTVMDKAAMYWYHPHLHGQTLKQVVKGAAGLIIVRDSEESSLNLPRTYGVDDIPLVFQFQTFDNTTKQIVENDELDNTVLVNGTINGMVNCPAQVVRLRLINASSHRVFRFGFENNQTFYQIGGDAGLLNAPVSMTRLTLGSGERAEILVNLSALEGTILNLKTFGNELPTGYPGGASMMGMQNGPLDNISFKILQINVIAPTQNPVTAIPNALTNNEVWPSSGATTRNMTLTAQPMMSPTNFFINGNQFDENVINFTTEVGNTEIWNITNQTMMAHPFHIHGNRFYVLQVNGSPAPANMQGPKDVVLIPPMGGSVKLITKFEDFSDPEMPYMYHCHILSHEDKGMMGQFIVNPSTATHNFPELEAEVQISPNPAFSSFELIINLTDNQPVEVNILDIMGRKMSTHYFSNIMNIDFNMDCSDWPVGLYTVKIIQNEKNKSVKFLKQ